MRALRSRALVGLAAALAFAAAVALQIARDRLFPRSDAQSAAILYVPSGAVLQRLVLSYDALAADVYWIRAIQYYGGNRLAEASEKHHYELLYPMLDIATTLDPYFNIAYRFGAIFLSEGYPGGPGRPDLAVALLRKGIAARPAKWEYYLDIGFVYYWHLHDYRAAADWFQRASTQPGAPIWLRPLTATMLVKGQDRAAARFLWQQIARSEESWLRRSAARALQQLDALDQIDRLQPIVASDPPQPGRSFSWEWLVRRGRLPGVPVDPAGVPYLLDAETGRIEVSPDSPIFPMPADTRRTLQ